jgi:hypothetical protein
MTAEILRQQGYRVLDSGTLPRGAERKNWDFAVVNNKGPVLHPMNLEMNMVMLELQRWLVRRGQRLMLVAA